MLVLRSERLGIETRAFIKNEQMPPEACTRSTSRLEQRWPELQGRTGLDIYFVPAIQSVSFVLSHKFMFSARRHIYETWPWVLYTWYSYYYAGVPVGLVGYPRAYQNRFRAFNSHRVHLLVGTFSCIKKLLAESARAWVSNIRRRSTTSGNAEPYAR